MSTEGGRTIPESRAKDSPAVGDSSQDDSQSVPRSAGVISEAGEVLNESGKSIGKITDSKDPQELIGNTVTSGGDIVDKSGKVLGHATLGDDGGDYTTKPQKEDNQNKEEGEQKSNPVSDIAKGVAKTASGAANTFSSGLGISKDDDQPEAEKPQTKSVYEDGGHERETPEIQLENKDDIQVSKGEDKEDQQVNVVNGVNDKVDDVKENVEAKTKDTPADDATKDVPSTDDAKDAAPSTEDAKDAASSTEDVKDNVKDTTDEAKDAAPSTEDVKEDAKDTTEEVKENVPCTGDVKEDAPSTEDAKDAAPSTDDAKDAAPSTGDVKDNVPSTEDAKDVAPSTEDVKDDVKDTTDETKDAAPSTEDVKEDVPPTEDAPTTEDIKDDAQETVEDIKGGVPSTDDAKDITEGVKDGAEETAEDVKNAAEDITEEAKGEVPATKDVKDGAEETAEDVKDDAQETAEDVKDDAPAGDEAKDVEGAADEEAEKAPEIDFSVLKGTTVNKAGNLVNKDGDVIGRIVEGDIKRLVGKRADENGDIWNDSGRKIGHSEPVPDNERDNSKDSAPFENFPGAVVEADGRITFDGKQVGKVIEGDLKSLQGNKVDEDGDILDRRGNVIGKAERWTEPEAEPEAPEEKADVSILKGSKVNKAGNLVDKHGDIVGRIVEGDVKALIGKRSDENGDIWDDAGKKVGRAEPVPDNERENSKENAPFENFPDAIVEADGRVLYNGEQVGVVVDGDPKRLKGSKVDEDGDILDRRGNVVGKAERWTEPEAAPEEKVDQSILAGKRVNKAGNVVDGSGVIYGRVIEGNVSNMIGRMCDKEGNVRSESGDIIGKAQIVGEGEREGSKEGPFAELSGLTVAKDGTVVTPSGDVVGRLTSGDPKALFGRSVDEDGDVVDRNGNVLAKAERWEKPEEPEVEKKKGPLAGRKVDREGNVRNEDGNIIGKLVAGEAVICAGKEIDDDGDVINSKGQTIGHASLLEDIPPEPEKEEEEPAEVKEERLQAEKDKKLAGSLAGVVEQSLDKIRPICKRIAEHIDKAERTPKEELDEEALVKQVRPLIEEGGKILTETNGAIRGMDPDGRIQRNAKHKSATREASPEEFHLADVLKELTGTVTECIDNAKRKIDDMPHAKKELNPLWGLLAEPLGQILAAVGLLLNGVLGLVGRLLSGLGLGGLVDNLLGGLGLTKILKGLGVGSVVDSLTGKKK